MLSLKGLDFILKIDYIGISLGVVILKLGFTDDTSILLKFEVDLEQLLPVLLQP